MSFLSKIFRKIDVVTSEFDNEPFKMVVDSSFYIDLENRGTVAQGVIESGVVREGDIILLTTKDGIQHRVSVKGIEFYEKGKTIAQKGVAVGILISDIKKGELCKGDVLQGINKNV